MARVMRDNHRKRSQYDSKGVTMACKKKKKGRRFRFHYESIRETLVGTSTNASLPVLTLRFKGARTLSFYRCEAPHNAIRATFSLYAQTPDPGYVDIALIFRASFDDTDPTWKTRRIRTYPQDNAIEQALGVEGPSTICGYVIIREEGRDIFFYMDSKDDTEVPAGGGGGVRMERVNTGIEAVDTPPLPTPPGTPDTIPVHM